MHVQNIIIVLFNNLVLQSLQQSLNWYLWWINDSLQRVTWLKKERDKIEFYISYNSSKKFCFLYQLIQNWSETRMFTMWKPNTVHF